MHSTHVPRPANPCSEPGTAGVHVPGGQNKHAAANRQQRRAVVPPLPAPARSRPLVLRALVGPLHPPNLACPLPPASPPSVASSPDPPSLWEGPWIPRSPRPSFHCHRHRHGHRPHVRGDLVPLSGRLTERSRHRRHASSPSAPRRPSPVRSIWGHGQGRCMAFHELETPRRC